MSRSTFFLSRSRFLKLRFFSRDFDASRFLSRLSRHVEIVEICRDASRFLRFLRFVEMQSRFVETLSRFVEKSRHCRALVSLKMLKSLDGLRNLNEKIQKSTHFSIEIETNCRETPKFSDLDEILNLDRDFLVWTLMSRRNWDISIIETYFLTLSRLTLWWRLDRESRSRPRRDKSRPPRLQIS